MAATAPLKQSLYMKEWHAQAQAGSNRTTLCQK